MMTNTVTITQNPTTLRWDAQVMLQRHGIFESIQDLYSYETALSWANMTLVYHDNRYVRCC